LASPFFVKDSTGRTRLKGESRAFGRWRFEAMEFGIGNAECGKLKQRAYRKGKIEGEKVIYNYKFWILRFKL
jgi:hypothetical protein